MKIKYFRKFIVIIFFCFFILENITMLYTKNPSKIIVSSKDIKKEVYLTFDDGPIPVITDKLLDILKQNNVKATFFVVGKEIKGREKILKRIQEDGHGIGLHTYTHNFSTIYKSNNEFIHELDKTAYMIKREIGYNATAVRFPGGSDKMLSLNLLEILHDKNYRVYDWNVNLGDGDNPRQSIERIVNNSKRAKGNQNRRFILAHCNATNFNTCKALPEIIKYYKNENFEFKKIENTTIEYYYKFKIKS